MDLTMAMVLVLFIILSAYEVWGMTVSKLDSFMTRRTLEHKLRDVSELLVRTGGDPTDWSAMTDVDADNVRSIGFAAQDNVLDFQRLEKAQTIDYESLREFLGLGKEDVYVTVTELESGNRRVYYEMGRQPDGTRVTANRYALLNDTIVEVKVTLYYSNQTYMTT